MRGQLVVPAQYLLFIIFISISSAGFFGFVCWIILPVSRICLRAGLWDFIEIILIAAGLNEIPAIHQLAELVVERGTWHSHVPF